MGACDTTPHARARRRPGPANRRSGGMTLYRRITLIVADGWIEHVFYPVFPPDAHAGEVLTWLRDHPAA